MKIYDSSIPLLTATASGAAVILQPIGQGTAVPPKAITGGAHLVIKNVTTLAPTTISPGITWSAPTSVEYSGQDLTQLAWAGPYGNAPLQVVLSGVVSGDSLALDGQTFLAVASGASGTQFNVGSNDTATAVNLAAAISTYYAGFRPGMAYRTDGYSLLLQASVNGTGAVTANIDIQASLDGINWVSLGSNGNPAFALTGTNSVAALSPEQSGFPWIRANPQSITGTNAVATVTMKEVNPS